MKKLFTFFSCLLMALSVWGQGKITGQVIDENQKLAEFVNVTLHKSQDSSLVKAALTDKQGIFEFEAIKFGKYFVSISQVGYQKLQSPSFVLTIENPAIKLNELSLSIDAKALKEVIVRTQKPFVERQIDRTVLNVESSITSAGSTAMEVLEKAPGVTVDADGNIALKGKQGVLVMIDDKLTYLSPADLATMLRGMAANQIEKIELITNPPARYDAAGNSGIINIKLKKDQRLGMNGSANLSLGQGLHFKENAGLSLNFRDKKLNWFTNITQVNRGGENRTMISRKFRNNDVVSSILYQNSTQNITYTNQNVKLGVDYFISRKTTLGIVLNGTHNNIEQNVLTNNDFTDGNGLELYGASTQNTTKDRWLNFTGNINFKHTFDSTSKGITGRELTIDMDILRFDEQIDQNSVTYNLDNLSDRMGTPYILRGDLPSIINVKSLKIDYIHPLTKQTKFEAGAKSSYVTNDGNAQYYLREGNTETVDSLRTNHFVYEENINAAYINLTHKFNQLEVQLGLRGEHTYAKGMQLTTNTIFTRNYFQLFPTVFIKQELDKNNELGFTFGRRIQRPDYQSLNPFRFFLDLYTYRQGNPELQPQFAYNSDITYTYKQQYSITAYYSRTSDIISTVLIQDDATKVAYQVQKNLDNLETIGINTYLPFKPAKWWNCNMYVEVYDNKYSTNFLTGRFDQHQTTFFVNSNNTFTLGKTWSAEMTGYYQSAFLYGTFKFLPQSLLSLGIQKSLWNRKGTLKINVADVLLTQQQNLRVNYQNLDMTLHRRMDTRYATIALTYRFGNGKVAPARRRNSGADEENRRVKVQES